MPMNKESLKVFVKRFRDEYCKKRVSSALPTKSVAAHRSGRSLRTEQVGRYAPSRPVTAHQAGRSLRTEQAGRCAPSRSVATHRAGWSLRTKQVGHCAPTRIVDFRLLILDLPSGVSNNRKSTIVN
jgi:hypothetical protein